MYQRKKQAIELAEEREASLRANLMPSPVADPGFPEGGFYIVQSCVRSVRKILKATPTFAHPFRSFLRQTTSPTSPIDLFSNEFSSKAF